MSLLPPRTAAKLKKLPRSERLLYAQELKGKYEYRRNHLQTLADKLALEWVAKQADHFDVIIDELDEIVGA